MRSRDFCFWLQGFFEISTDTSLTHTQLETIKNHLNLVFEHEIDPSIDNNDPKLKEKLDNIHKPPTTTYEVGSGEEISTSPFPPRMRC